MRYPFKVEGQTAADGYPLQLFPPPQIVKDAARLMAVPSDVLDIGAYTGTNGFYLAREGHSVDSIEINPDYIRDGKIIARALGSLAGKNTFINTDIRRFVSERPYDAAIATNTLHMLGEQEARNTLSFMKNIIQPQGLNVVRAYVATPEQQEEFPDLALLRPLELEDIYKKAGWKIISYAEQIKPILMVKSPTDLRAQPKIESAAELIARKGQAEDLVDIYRRQIELYEHTNPELADLLREQLAHLEDS